MELANNSHIKSFKASNGNVMEDFSGKELEHTYFLRDSQEIKSFLENEEIYVQEMLNLRKNLNFVSTRANFKFGKQKVNLKLIKSLINFQNKSFDKIVVPLVQEDFEIFKQSFEYAKEHFNKPVLVFADIKLRDPMLVEMFLYFRKFAPDGVIWKYRKIHSNIQKYRFISKTLQDMRIPYFCSECNKRYGVDNFWEISVSAVLKSYFGFDSCCMNYKYPSKKGFPANNLDKFNFQTCSWEKQNKGDYYNKKLKDFLELNKIPKSFKNLSKIGKLKKLFDFLDKK